MCAWDILLLLIVLLPQVRWSDFNWSIGCDNPVVSSRFNLEQGCRLSEVCGWGLGSWLDFFFGVHIRIHEFCLKHLLNPLWLCYYTMKPNSDLLELQKFILILLSTLLDNYVQYIMTVTAYGFLCEEEHVDKIIIMNFIIKKYHKQRHANKHISRAIVFDTIPKNVLIYFRSLFTLFTNIFVSMNYEQTHVNLKEFSGEQMNFGGFFLTLFIFFIYNTILRNKVFHHETIVCLSTFYSCQIKNFLTILF